MLWVMEHTSPDGTKSYWHEEDYTPNNSVLGVKGWLVGTLAEATKVQNRVKENGDNKFLGAGLAWKLFPQRHKSALLIQSAVNPSGVALSFHEALCEVIREGGDTAAQCSDAAAVLMLNQLNYLYGFGSAIPLTDYQRAYNECVEKAKGQ